MRRRRRRRIWVAFHLLFKFGVKFGSRIWLPPLFSLTWFLGQIGASGFKPPQKSYCMYVFNNDTIISKEIFEPKACNSLNMCLSPFPSNSGTLHLTWWLQFCLSFLQVELIAHTGQKKQGWRMMMMMVDP